MIITKLKRSWKKKKEEEVRMDSSSFALAKIDTLIDCTSE